MNNHEQAVLMDRAREATEQGEWRQAHELLVRADANKPLDGFGLALLADAAYAAGNLDATIDAWERAHARAMRADDQVAAAEAAVRIAMHLLFDTALMAPVRGWATRAERLLVGHDETPAYAWLAVVRSYERLLSGDLDGARPWARRAVEIGARCNPAAAAIGRVAEARIVILEGDIRQGLDLLNDAAVAIVSGEVEPLPTGIVYCEVVCALQGLAQYDLAEEWTAAMERWRQGQPIGSLHGRCRVHRAEILRLRGSCVEAEQESILACDELRPYLRREYGWPLTELGRIRLRMGDVEGAEQAFREAHEAGWDPQPGLALVSLHKGDVDQAAASIRRALAHPSSVPSKELPPNTELRRAPLLEAQVEIEIAAGNVDAAQSAADQLSQVAQSFQSKGLAASAALARGRVWLARGDIDGALREFGRAAQLWNEVGAPYETALARMGLARAHRAAGNEEEAVLEFRAARSGFERVGARHLEAEAARACTVGATLDEEPRHTIVPRALQTTRRSNPEEYVFSREGDYWLLVFQGRTVRLRDLKGLAYLARLLAYPGREFHVLELVTGESASAIDSSRLEPNLALSSGSSGGPLLDAKAKDAYRRRLAEIDEDIEEAGVLGNEERAAQAEVERDWLVRELARAVGLGGRDRRAASDSERARASVTRAVRHAMNRVSQCHPELGAHLDRAIRTGTYCAYLPDPRFETQWRIQEEDEFNT